MDPPRATKLLPASYFTTKFELLSEWMNRVMGRGRGHIWGGIDLKLVKTAIFNVERGGGTYLGGIFGNDGQPDSKSHHLKTH